MKEVRALGWYLEEQDLAQVSINLSDFNVTSLHTVYEECCSIAKVRMYVGEGRGDQGERRARVVMSRLCTLCMRNTARYECTWVRGEGIKERRAKVGLRLGGRWLRAFVGLGLGLELGC